VAEIIVLPTHHDPRGSLTVLEKVLPFVIERVFWIYDLPNDQTRGQHRHQQTWQGMVCMRGSVEVIVKKYAQETLFTLDSANQVLILAPDDWHEMRQFTDSPILLLLASHGYDPKDYIKEPLV